MSHQLKTPTFFLLPLLFPGALHAGWYVGANAGLARTDVSSGELNDRLAGEGLSGSADIDKSERLGWRMFGGYQWGDYIAVEGGYTDLGEIDASYNGSDTLSAQNLQAVFPPSASGYELSLLGRYPFSDTASAFIRGGALAWQSEYNDDAGGAVSYSGTDPFIGIGGEWHFNERWGLRLAWDRYTVAQDDTDLLSLGVSYRFAERKQTAKHDEEKPVATTPVHPTAEPVAEPPAETPVEPPVTDEPPAQASHVTAPPIEPKPAPEPKPEPAPTAIPAQQWQLHYDFEAIEPADAQAPLAAATQALTDHPHTVVHITGYADTTGPEAYNLYLSRQRAEWLAEKLADRGIDTARITTEGKGGADPVADNTTRAGRAANRRAVILVHQPSQPETP